MSGTIGDPLTKLILHAIRAGAYKVHPRYVGHVLCLASRGLLTATEMDSLRFSDGRRIF